MKPKMFITLMTLCSLGVITTGCSTFNSSKPTEAQVREQAIVAAAEKNKVTEKIPEAAENEIPSWFLETEINDGKILTVTATDISKDMQFAIDKAMLNGKIQLAQKLGTTVESLVRESSLETGYGSKDVERDLDRVSRAKTNQKIGFFTRQHLKVVKEGENYRAYVMLKLSVEEGRRMTQAPKNNNSREDLFKELDSVTQPPAVTPPNAIQERPL